MSVTRTVRVENPAVTLIRTSAGEYLRFLVNHTEPAPSFALGSLHGVLFAVPGRPPMATYEWFRFKDPADPQGVDSLLMSFIFLGCKGYSYTIELWNASGFVTTILDLSYTALPTDHWSEPLKTVTA